MFPFSVISSLSSENLSVLEIHVLIAAVCLNSIQNIPVSLLITVLKNPKGCSWKREVQMEVSD